MCGDSVHGQVLDQQKVIQRSISSVREQLDANERRSQERHDAQMSAYYAMAHGVHTWAYIFREAVQFPPHHQVPRPAFGNDFHNMTAGEELDQHLHHPQLLGFFPHHQRRRRLVPLLPAPPTTVPLLPAPPPANRLSITTIDSHPPSTHVRSQQSADPARAQTPTSAPSAPQKKKRKVSEATGVSDVTEKRPPIPSFDSVTIRAVAEEWLIARPPHCSLRAMMKTDGPEFDAWRKDHKSRIDHRKNIWWAVTCHAKELESESESRNEQSILNEVVRRLENQKNEMGGTLDQFIMKLPPPPQRVWRFQL